MPLPPLIQGSAGAVGSVISNAAVYPLDVLTTRLQTASGGYARRKGAKSSSRVAVIYSTMKRMLREGGVASFYRGLASDSLSTFISNFLYFFCYSHLRDALVRRRHPLKQKDDPPPLLSAFEEILVGMMAGIVAKGVVSPLSNITVRAQTAVTARPSTEKASREVNPVSVIDVDNSSSEDEEDEYDSPSNWSIIRDIYEEKGWSGFWSGFKSSILLTTNPALSFYLFELFKRMVIPVQHQAHPTPLQTFLSSALASSLAAVIVYPLILAKTRLQSKSPSGRRMYASNLDVFRQTIRRRGWKGLYAGLESQVVKNFFSEGIKLLVKDRLELLIVLLYRTAARRRRVSTS